MPRVRRRGGEPACSKEKKDQPLCNKAALRTAWVAAVRGVAALTREQVDRADIAASVDKILHDVETRYRILGLLLFGIARIYSKKVEYLHHDCDKILESFESTRPTQLVTSTGGATHRVLKQVKKAVRARQLVVEQDVNKVKKRVSALISIERLSSRAETGVTSQTSPEVEVARAGPTMFTIPPRFELDSFDLGISEDRDDDEDHHHHQLPRQDISLEDENHRTSYFYESYKSATWPYADQDSACFMPVRITLPAEFISTIEEFSNLLYVSKGGDELERDDQYPGACFTPVKDVLPPEMVNTVVEANDPSDKSKRGKNPRRELNRDDSGDAACSIPLPDQVGQISEDVVVNTLAGVNDPSDKSRTGKKPRRELNRDDDGDSACSIPLPESQGAQISEDVENVTCPSANANYLTIEESENGLLQRKSKADPSVQSYHDNEEHDSQPPILCCKTNLMSPSTPEPLMEGAAGLPYSSKFMVTTPAKKEKRQAAEKRKRGIYSKENIPTDRKDNRKVRTRVKRTLHDRDVILPNRMMREATADASDLLRRKATKATRACLNTWKVARIGSLPHTFMDPLIAHSTLMHLSKTTTPDAPESSCGESVKARRRLSLELSEDNNPDEPINRKSDELTNNIQVHVDSYTETGQFQGDACECNDDTDKAKGVQVEGHESCWTGLPEKRSSCESKNYSPLRYESLNAVIDGIDEDIPMEEQHSNNKGLLHSTRTRAVAMYFHRQFLDQQDSGQSWSNSISLGQALEGRNWKAAARFFSETLVLTNLDLIKVNQEQPYDDITLSATPQLEAAIGSSGS